MESRKRYVGSLDLVLAGGGVKGIGHVGAIEVLEARGYDQFQRVVGTSVGAIVGALVAAGMPATEINESLMGFDFRKLRDGGLLDRVPVLGKPASVLLGNGVFRGDAIWEWMNDLLAAHNAETFGKLKKRARERLGRKIRKGESPLTVLATDVTRGRLVRFPQDYKRYQRVADDQLVADAVRASLSIPLFFEPVKLHHSLIVDGGVLSNYAIGEFDAHDPADALWPTFGVTLLGKDPKPTLGRDIATSVLPALRFAPGGLTDFLEDLIGTTIVGQDMHELDRRGVKERTIQIDADETGIVQFDITPAQKQVLIARGRDAASAFLDGWNGDDGRPGVGKFPIPRGQ